MATLISACGAECGIDGSSASIPTGATLHNTGFGATATVQVGGGLTNGSWSGRSYKLNPSAATTDQFTHRFPTVASPATVVVRFYINFTTLPGAMRTIATNNPGTSGLRYNPTGTKLEVFAGQSPQTYAGSFVPSTNTWYRIDMRQVTGTTFTTDWQVDGNAQTTASRGSQSAVGSTGIVFGHNANNTAGHASTTATATYYIDDIAASGTSGDYPLGAGRVAALFPSADGTHSYDAATDFQIDDTTNLNATSGSETGTWSNLQNPLSITVNHFLAQNAASSTEYLEWQFANLAESPTSINGLIVVSTHHSASTLANAQSLRIEDGATEDAVLALVDYSDTTLSAQGKMYATAPSSGAAWTESKVNALKARWGYSNDINPVPYIDGICFEVDYIKTGGVSRDLAAKVDTASKLATAVNRTQRYIAKVSTASKDKATNIIEAKHLLTKANSATSAKAGTTFAKRIVGKSGTATYVHAAMNISGQVSFSVKVSEVKNLRMRRVSPPQSSLARNLQAGVPNIINSKANLKRVTRPVAKSNTASKAKATLAYNRRFTVVGATNKPKIATSAKATMSTTSTPSGGNIPAIPATILAGEPAWRIIAAAGGYTMMSGYSGLQAKANIGRYGTAGSFGGQAVIYGYGGDNHQAIKEVNGTVVSAAGDQDLKYGWQCAYENLTAPGINAAAGTVQGNPIAGNLTHFRGKANGIIKWAGMGVKLRGGDGGGAPADWIGGPFGDIFDTARYANVAHQFGLMAGFVKMMGGDGMYWDPEFGSWPTGATTPKPPSFVGKTDEEILAAYEAWGLKLGTEIYTAFPACSLLLYGFVFAGSAHDAAIYDNLLHTQGTGRWQNNTTNPFNRVIIGLLKAHANLNATGHIYDIDAHWYRVRLIGNTVDGLFKWSHMNVAAHWSQDLPVATWSQIAPYWHYTVYSWAGTDTSTGSTNTQETDPGWSNGQGLYRTYAGGGLRGDYTLGAGEGNSSGLWQVTQVIIGGVVHYANQNGGTVKADMVQVQSPTQIVVPRIKAGTGIVDVVVVSGSNSSAGAGSNGWGGNSARTTTTRFNYGDGGPNTATTGPAVGPSPPTITSISPTSGPAGTRLTINGTNFISAGTYEQSPGRTAAMLASASPASQDSSPISVSTVMQSRSSTTVTLTFSAQQSPHGIHRAEWKLYASNGTSILRQGVATMVYNGHGADYTSSQANATQDCTCVITGATTGLYVILDVYTPIAQRTSRRVQIV